MYWDTNDLLMEYSGGQCMPGAAPDNCNAQIPCSVGHVKCCHSFNCSEKTAPLCGPDPFPDALAAVFEPSWAVRKLVPAGRTGRVEASAEAAAESAGEAGREAVPETVPVPQCLYYFGLQYVPFEESSNALAAFLAKWVQAKGFDGLYLDEYFPPDVYQSHFTGPGAVLFPF
jgi:hypothetical protein